jgi:nucleotide-binding universal stress UspA family protein
LTLLHATPKLHWHFAAAEGPGELRTGDGDTVLAAAETEARSAHPDLTIHTAAVQGPIATVLTEVSQSARLLVIGTGAGNHRALGGHAVRIAHRTQCPVVVWRSPVAQRTGAALPVVVGIDESEHSTRALAEAFEVARTLYAPLTVVHMWEIGAAVGMGGPGSANG